MVDQAALAELVKDRIRTVSGVQICFFGAWDGFLTKRCRRLRFDLTTKCCRPCM